MSTDDSDTLDRESNELLGRMQSFAKSVSANVHSRDEKIRALKVSILTHIVLFYVILSVFILSNRERTLHYGREFWN